jgi:hypothetical protein
MNIPISLLLIITTLLLPGGVFAQCMEDNLQSPPDRGASEPYMSMHGKNMVAHGTVRALVVLVEFDYANPALDPYPNGTAAWPAHALPNWVDNVDLTYNLFEHDESAIPPQASMTRFLWDASGGDFHLVADYLSDIVTLPTTNGLAFSLFPSTVAQVCNAINQSYTTLTTHFGNDAFSDYDKWTISSSNSGLDRPPVGDSSYDHVFFIFRNALDASSGTGRASPGSPGTILTHAANSYTVFGAENAPPTKIMCHEFSHLQFGGNAFHCAGGGNTPPPYYVHQYWISQVGGWSMMGAANASLMTWSAWDRYRLGWTSDTNHSIVCRDEANLNNKNGDLNPMNPTDAGTYLLRDFVASGDAIRIKLPYTDPSKSPQYLWMENHQGRDQNGHPFDRWHYEDAPCVENLVPGLNMYMQIDREVRTSTIYSEVFAESHPTYGGYEDYLRPLDASGHYDLTYGSSIISPQCVGGETYYPFVRALPNPLTGMGDTHWNTKDRNGDGELRREHDFTLNQSELLNGVVNHHLYNLGNPRQEFTLTSNHTLLGIGTNPSSASAMNIVGGNGNGPSSKNLRRIYLNGVSVELMAQNTDGSIKVQVRFDDVDVDNDARWCADEIQLNPVATSTGYSLNVTAGKTVTLDRGTTATRRNNPEMYNGQPVFNSATLMRCPANTWLNLDPNSNFVVDGGSTLRLESGSRLDVGNGAVLRVKRGSRLELMGGSVLNVLPGGQVIIEEDWQPWNHGRLVYYPNARINLEASTSVLEVAGVLDIQANATFTPARSGDPNTTYGLVKFTNTSPTSYNVAAGANSRFIMRGTSPNGRILHVQQESLYGPTQLVEFSLLNAKATLADNARIVPPVTNSAIVKVDNATVTSSTGVRNTHRGVRLNGQALLTLNNSTFSMGSYGVYSYNTTLGNSPVPVNCSFIDCNTGMYNYDKGIKAISCKFDKCTNGLQCVQMAHTSYLIDCSAQRNAQTGVSFSGSSTLNVKNPAFNYNAIGLSVGQATAVVACGSVSLNELYGFKIHHGGTLRMDDNHTGHDPVTAVKNGTSIYCQQANNVYLDLGLNSLKPMVPGYQKSLYGTFLCAPYSVTQPARKNNWNGTVGTPLTSADYSITTCGAALLFDDPSSSAEITCGQVPLSVPVNNEFAGAPLPAWMENCIGCAMVMSADSVMVPLNLASMAALNLGYNDSLPDNELLALAAFHALLASPVTDPGAQEKFLLEYGHGLMQESFGDALEKGQLDPATDNANMDTHLAMMTDVEDARTGAAAAEGQDDFVFYTSLQRAQLTRATGKLDDAIAQMQAIPQPPDTGQQALLSTILCYTQTERSVINGTYTWDEVEAAMLSCTGHGGPKMMVQPMAEGPDALPLARPTLQPNPAATEVRVQGFAGEDCLLRLLDITGRTVVQEVQFNNSTTLPLQAVRPGTYLCRITSSKGQLWTGRLVVAW